MIIEPWALIDHRPDSSPTARTLFNLSNGRLGLRGALEEDRDIADQGFVNGFHETWPITYPEDAYGLARVGQTIQPVPNPTAFQLVVDGEVFDPHHSRIDGFERRLDYRSGQLTRRLTWHTDAGATVRIESARLVSMVEPGAAGLRYQVSVDRACRLDLTSYLTLPRTSHEDGTLDPRRGTQVSDPLVVIDSGVTPGLHATIATRRAGQTMTCVMAHEIDRPALGSCLGRPLADLEQGATDAHNLDGQATDTCADDLSQTTAASGSAGQAPGPRSVGETGDRLSRTVSADLAAGQDCTLTVLACFDPDAERAWSGLDRLQRRGWDDLAAAQADYLDHWWRSADVTVDSTDPAVQGTIRWNLFQVLQASACAQGASIAAKGVSGSGYDGHYFWDCESMVLPALVHTAPTIARRILAFRHATLPQALERARELSLKGAAFPWRTINGQEASAFFEAGTAQFHINADITYAVNRYLRATNDEDYAAGEGIDLLVQTARLWADLGFFGRDEHFHIHGVTGPDEYSALVDDNLYTNVMARTNLELADHWLAHLAENQPDAHTRAITRLGVTDDEREVWRRAAAAMAMPFDPDLGVHGQDAHFLEHEIWDFQGTPPQNHPLLLHYHPLTIYRHQVLKQADTVLAELNRPDLFSPEQKLADFDYYDPLTSGDSTLSASAQSIMAAEVGHMDLAESYFLKALATDLDDSHANAADGVHVASAGAIWSTLTMGFGGLRDWKGLRLDPHLPPSWSRLRFRLRIATAVLEVDITHDDVGLTLITANPDAPTCLTVRDRPVSLTADAPSITIRLTH
ncbi:MAG: glycoside hydrolase family 65 protein [Propionibacteriaceae bacterium]|nr:glycoside hydrolase family 65 protein [Propionibacteriaceae bacterium]